MNLDKDLIDIIMRITYVIFVVIGFLREIKKIRKKKTKSSVEVKIVITGNRNIMIFLLPKQKPYNVKNDENVTRGNKYNPEPEA